MINIKDPLQKPLFEPLIANISKVGLRYLGHSWQPTFRVVILDLLRQPVSKLSKNFNSTQGRKTKELYSMAGLLIIKQFNNWTTREAIEAYMFHSDIQFALNIDGAAQGLSDRTLENYEKKFMKNDLASEVMHEVTIGLAKAMDLDVKKQRLDSTHILSDMAKFGRNRMMGIGIKRFLTNLRRHNRNDYKKLPEALLTRYKPSTGNMFSDVKKGEHGQLTQQIAEDLHALIIAFERHAEISKRSTFKALQAIFNDQCEIEEQAVFLKKKTGGDVVQNTSDMDATYDGHKGVGYQAQFSETCSDKNDSQLILSAIVQTACESDSDAVGAVLADLESKDCLPEEIPADTAYCSDENVLLAQEKGVDLIGPVPGSKPAQPCSDEEALTIDDFVINNQNDTIVNCPAGYSPKSSSYNKKTKKMLTVMSGANCANCSFKNSCIVTKKKKGYVIAHSAKDVRLAARRKEEQTEVFKERYSIRSGIEATNSSIKRRTGMSRLRVRGLAAIKHGVELKVTGWNVLRGSQSEKIKQRVNKWMKDAIKQTLKITNEVAVALEAAFFGQRREEIAGLATFTEIHGFATRKSWILAA